MPVELFCFDKPVNRQPCLPQEHLDSARNENLSMTRNDPTKSHNKRFTKGTINKFENDKKGTHSEVQRWQFRELSQGVEQTDPARLPMNEFFIEKWYQDRDTSAASRQHDALQARQNKAADIGKQSREFQMIFAAKECNINITDQITHRSRGNLEVYTQDLDLLIKNAQEIANKLGLPLLEQFVTYSAPHHPTSSQEDPLVGLVVGPVLRHRYRQCV